MYFVPGTISGLARPVSVPVPPDFGQFVGSHRVTVCDTAVRFFQTTLVPDAMVGFLGR